MSNIMIFMFVVIGTVGAISALVYFLASKSESKKKYFVASILVFFVILVFILPTLIFTKILTIWELFSYASDSLNRYLGISIWLNRAIVVAALVPLLTAMKYAFSFNNLKRKVGYAAIVTYACGFFVLMHFGTKDMLFTHDTGEAQKWISIAPNGEVRMYDSPGFDMVTGKPLDSLTPELAQQIELLRQFDMENFDATKAYFHPGTGVPLKWYSEDEDSTIVIHDQGGYSAGSGQKLRPLTAEIISRIKEQLHKREVSAKIELDSMDAIANAAEKARQLLESQQKYLIMGNALFGKEERIALTVVENGSDIGWSNIDRGVQELLSQAMVSKGFGVASNPFKKQFFADGKLMELVSGNGDFLTYLRPRQIADIFLIATVASSISESKQLKGTKTCRFKINATAYDSSGRLISQGAFSATGLGFDEESARKKAIRAVAADVIDMIKAIK